ncbi:porin family protein, partial [Altererythrobacter sp. KTW20L]|uniref:outer membrane beta-barrel protein n=1 Tax=Altererythrobacter sp. KTW20L TaxID=2942210 RepID=UPI0020C0A931
MRKCATGLLLATSILAAPAMARDGQVYLGIEGGVVRADDITFAVTGAPLTVTAEPKDIGWEAGAVLGYDFGMVRLEGEAAYKRFGIDTITGPVGPIPTGGTYFASGTYAANGDVRVGSGMANLLLDFGGNDGIGFSIGGGVGIADVDIKDIAVPGRVALDDNDMRFAWQGIARLYAPLSDTIELGLKYRYFRVDDATLNDRYDVNEATVLGANARNLGYDLVTHSLLASLTVGFGGRQVAPPPPP